MAVEIERKFLVNIDKLPKLENGVFFKQGYIPSSPGNVVRIRTAGEIAYITIKGKTEGYSRLEYEYEIPVSDAEEMLEQLCLKPIISKVRYKIKFAGKIWELDIFDLDNKGLYLAEIELEFEEESFEKPEWIGREVSHLKEYRNRFLADHPYRTWKKSY